MLIQYVRRGKKTKKYVDGMIWPGRRERLKGVMVAFKEDDILYIGWSLCHHLDKFDHNKAINIATERSCKWNSSPINKRHYCNWYINDGISIVPQSITDEFVTFIKRSLKYFKEREINIPQWIINFLNDYKKYNEE